MTDFSFLAQFYLLSIIIHHNHHFIIIIIYYNNYNIVTISLVSLI